METTDAYSIKKKIITPDSYYPDKKQFIFEFEAVLREPGKFHLKQGEVRIKANLEKTECDRYFHIHMLNFKEMKIEVVE